MAHNLAYNPLLQRFKTMAERPDPHLGVAMLSTEQLHRRVSLTVVVCFFLHPRTSHCCLEHLFVKPFILHVDVFVFFISSCLDLHVSASPGAGICSQDSVLVVCNLQYNQIISAATGHH